MTTLRADDGGRWYVVHTKPTKEAFARAQLATRGVRVFLPRLLLPAYVPEHRRIVPLFPGYLMVRIHLASQFSVVVWSPGVKAFVGPGGGPAVLDEDVAAFLIARASPDGIVAARPAMSPGQEVEITEGPFAGLVGIVQRPPDARGRVRVLMQLLNRRPVTVQVPVRQVKNGWLPDPTDRARTT